MKKYNKYISIIMSFLIISNIFLLNNTNAYNWYKLSESDIKNYNKLLEEQTPEELQVEIQLQKLQKNIIKSIRDKYDILLSKTENIDSELKNIYWQNNIYNNTKVDINITSNNKLSELSGWMLGYNIENWTELLDLNMNNVSNMKSNEDIDFINSKWELNISLFKSSISGIYNFDQYISDWDIIIKNNRTKIKEYDFQYDPIIGMISPYINEDNFNDEVKVIEKRIKNINTNLLKLQWKNIEIKDEQVNNKMNTINDISLMFNEFKSEVEKEIKKSKIDDLFKTLEKEKLLYVYSWNNDKYKIVPNFELYEKINYSLGKEIFPVMSYADFKTKIESKRLNIIEKDKNNNFKYLDKDKNNENIVYVNFSEEKIHVFLLKEKENIVLFNKNKIQFKNTNDKGIVENVWSVEYLDGYITWKMRFSEKDYTSTITMYMSEDMSKWNLKIDVKQKDIELWTAKLSMNNTEDKKLMKFELLVEDLGDIETGYLNKDGKIEIIWEYKVEWNKGGNEISIIDTSMLPVNITWKITNIFMTNDKEVNIVKPKEIHKSYNSWNELLNHIESK